jgi:hypothetical protein
MVLGFFVKKGLEKILACKGVLEKLKYAMGKKSNVEKWKF